MVISMKFLIKFLYLLTMSPQKLFQSHFLVQQRFFSFFGRRSSHESIAVYLSKLVTCVLLSVWSFQDMSRQEMLDKIPLINFRRPSRVWRCKPDFSSFCEKKNSDSLIHFSLMLQNPFMTSRQWTVKILIGSYFDGKLRFGSKRFPSMLLRTLTCNWRLHNKLRCIWWRLRNLCARSILEKDANAGTFFIWELVCPHDAKYRLTMFTDFLGKPVN